MRQLIVVGSQVDGYVSYDPQLAQCTFLHAIRTGLRDECVRTHMLPFLDVTSQVADNRLIQELHKAVAESEERKKKTKPKTAAASAKVSFVETRDSDLAVVLKKLEENENQVKVLQEQVSELLSSNLNAKKGWKKKGICDACVAAKKTVCKHCFKCSNEGHKSSDCPN